MKKFTLILMLFITAQLAIAQTVTLDVQVFKDNAYAATPEYVDGASVTLSHPDLLPDGETVIADASGIASFEIEEPTSGTSYNLEITHAGYTSLTTTLYLSQWTNFANPQKKALLYLYNVTFNVTDESDVAIENASIELSGYNPTPETITTDAAGTATIQRNAGWSDQSFTVTANGYDDAVGSFPLAFNSADYTVPTIVMEKAYPITFTVTDGTNPVEGANVELINVDGESESQVTDVNGQVVFNNRINGDYDYVITGSGYIDEYGSVTVSDADPTPAVSLSAGYDLSFTIINGSEASGSTTGLQQDTITIDGNEKITDASNNVLTFGVAPGSSYTFDNVKAGFITQSINTGVINENTNITIYMEPVYSVSFIVKDHEWTEVEGAIVTFNGVEKTTDVTGYATYTDIAASETDYDYTITGPAESILSPTSGNVSLPLISNKYLYGGNNVTQKFINLAPPYANWSLTGGGIDGIQVNFNGVTSWFDPWMGLQTYAAAGTYDYVITPVDVNYAILYGEVTLTIYNNPTVEREIPLGKAIGITVADESSNVLEGATVMLDGVDILSDVSGYAEFIRKAVNTTYTVRVSLTGYETYVGTIDLVDADILDELITLKSAYDITFNVVDENSAAIEGATIEFANNMGTTDANGDVILPAGDGDFEYIVKADGYAVYKDSVTIDGASATENIQLTEAGYALNFTVESGETDPYPVAGATITIVNTDENISETFTTDQSGLVNTLKIFKANVELSYTVSCDGFKDVTGSVTIVDSDVTIDPIHLYEAASDVKFVLYDQNTFQTIGGATLEFDGETHTMDENGEVIIAQVRVGNHDYVLNKQGYETLEASFTINSWTSKISMYTSISESDVKFVITDGLDSLENVEVIFAADSVNAIADTLFTDANGEVMWASQLNYDYTYEVNFTGYESQAGVVTILDLDTTVNIALNKYYTITFNVTDGTNAIEGADVTIGTNTVATDASGDAVFTDMINGDYNYTVAATGYVDVTGSVTVADANANEDITMYIPYSITFTVTDGTDAIEGADVTIGTTTIITDASGDAVFADMINGDHNYTVAATGYDDATGTVTVADADATEPVSMSLTVYTITFTVTDGTDAIEGADVTIGTTTIITDASGDAVFADMINGDHNYTVTATGYDDATGTVTVADANATEAVAMSSTVGFEDMIAKNIKVYPNPTTGNLNIDFEDVIKEDVTVQVINAIGTIIKQIQLKSNSVNSIWFDINDYPTGIYFVQIANDEVIKSIKIIKK